MKEKQFAILGLGRFGEALAITLSELGSNVIVVDKNEEKVQNIANYVTYAVQADVSDINALKSIGLKNVDAVIISITSDINSSIMGVVNAQELGIQEIYGKANLNDRMVCIKLQCIDKITGIKTVADAFPHITFW